MNYSYMTQVIVTDRPRKLVPEKCPAFILFYKCRRNNRLAERNGEF